MITPLERFILWVIFIAFVAVGMAGYVAYQDYVKPLIEMKERIEKIESIINKLPFKPFREGEGEVAFENRAGQIEIVPLSEISDRELRQLYQRSYAELDRRRRSRMKLETAS